MIGKKMNGTGFSDVLLEANLMTSGSLKGVINGTNYSRAIHCHKVMLEAFERLLMHKYLDNKGAAQVFDGQPGSSEELLKSTLEFPNKDAVENVLNDISLHK